SSGGYLFSGHPMSPGLPKVDEVELDGRRIELPKLELADFGLAYEAARLPLTRYEHDASFDERGRRWHPGDADLESLRAGDSAVFLIHACHWDPSVAFKVARTWAHGLRR